MICSGLSEVQKTQVRWSSSWIGTEPACMPVPADNYGQRGQRLQEIKKKKWGCQNSEQGIYCSYRLNQYQNKR